MAYLVSNLSHAIKSGRLNSAFHIVLDEAYPIGDQELSPYRGRHLTPEQDTFNYNLSLHRQVVERAFGILVQRWGVFWRPLQVKFDRIPLLIRVCAKLHNICVDRFGTTNPKVHREDIQRGDAASVRFTDGTGMFRGRRTDLERCTRRDDLARRLREGGYTRIHQTFSQQGQENYSHLTIRCDQINGLGDVVQLIG